MVLGRVNGRELERCVCEGRQLALLMTCRWRVKGRGATV